MSRPKTGSAEPNAVALAWKRNLRQLAANSDPTSERRQRGRHEREPVEVPRHVQLQGGLVLEATVRTRPRVARTIARWLT